jgi:NAD(P)-dependent dehydrogenase (short-subunit alcohol dehydrogenase family)
VSRWGRLDALVVNHGTLEPVARIADVVLEDWEKGFRANVTSAVGLVCSFLCSPRSGRIGLEL